MFGALLPGVDHLPHTHDLDHNAYSRGQPAWGAHLADELGNIVALHDPSTIAAVIVEPIAGSTGVLPPPVGYLDRLREICTRHGILLIFDEVITGFGRTGHPFGAQAFDVTPDLITLAKGLTSGVVPMGAVLAKGDIYDAFMTGPDEAIEFFHGYTYSGHPVAAAAGLAAQAVYREEGLFERAAALAPRLEDAVHALKGLPHVIDIRNYGLIGAVELEPVDGRPTLRAMEVFEACYEAGVLLRCTGDTMAIAPPLIIGQDELDQVVDTLATVLRTSNRECDNTPRDQSVGSGSLHRRASRVGHERAFRRRIRSRYRVGQPSRLSRRSRRYVGRHTCGARSFPRVGGHTGAVACTGNVPVQIAG